MINVVTAVASSVVLICVKEKVFAIEIVSKGRNELKWNKKRRERKGNKSSTNHQAKVLTPRHAMMHTRCAGLSKTFFDSITQRARNRNETLQINNKRKSTNK